jgi:hypothetical protein
MLQIQKEVIMNRIPTISVAALATVIFATLALSANNPMKNDLRTGIDQVCASGNYAAVLTGWELNGTTPTGKATYTSSDNRLIVEVKNVKLKDGTVLEVLIGDEKIGRLEPLKDGSAKASIVAEDKLDEKSRIRVFDDDRPIVSANLHCEAAQDSSN